MPRPCKRRRVCALPERRHFCSVEGGACQEPIRLTVDEFESIRLMDLEGTARTKVARFLTLGGSLTIGGGEFILCPSGNPGCGHCYRHCHKGGNSCEKDRGDL